MPISLPFSTRALVHALGSQTPTERCYVAKRYSELYEKQLVDVIKSECGRKPFSLALQYLSVPPDVAECHMIHDACDGYVHKMLIWCAFIFLYRTPHRTNGNVFHHYFIVSKQYSTF